MHNRNSLFYISLLLFVSLSCQQSGTSETEQYVIQLVANDIIEVDPKASRHMGLIIFHNFSFNEQGNHLLLHDFDSGYLTIINREGNYINHFGGKGSGPREFREILISEFDKDGSVIALDGSTGMFKRFSLDGELLEITGSVAEKGVWPRGKYMYQYNDHWFFTMEDASQPQNAEANTVARFDSDFESLTLFGKYDSFMLDKETLAKNPTMTLDKETGLIYVVQESSPYIMVYDADSLEFVEQIGGMHSPNYKPYSTDWLMHDSHYKIAQIVLNQSISSNIYATENYLLFFFINQTQEFFDTRDISTREHYFKVYSKDSHEFLGEIELPNAPVAVHPAGDTILILKDDDPDNLKFQAYSIVESNVMVQNQ